MSMEFIIGGGIISFLLMYFAKNVDEKEHFAIRLLSFSVAIILFILIAKAGYDSIIVCEPVVNVTQETYIYGENYSGYHGDYDVTVPANQLNLFHKNKTYTYNNYCYEKELTNSHKTLYKLVSYTVLIYMIYIVFYFVYYLINNFRLKYAKK